MDELTNQQTQVGHSAEDTCLEIRGYIITAQNKIVSTVNTAIMPAYHEIGEQVYKACGESNQAGYGKHLLQYLAKCLNVECCFQMRTHGVWN